MNRLIAIAVFVGSVLFVGGLASANPEEGKFYKIRNENSGMVLAVADDAGEDGAKIVQADFKKGDEAQHWKLVKAGEHYKLINRKSGKALEVPDGSKEPSIQLQLGHNRDVKNQKWTLEKVVGTFYAIKAVCSGMVIDVGDKEKEAGAHVNQFPLNSKGDRKNQKWEFIEVE